MSLMQSNAKANRFMRIILCLILVLVTSATSLLPHAAANDGIQAAAADGVLVQMDSTWRYLEDGSDQGTAWRDAAYDDSAWMSGPAPLGYASAGKGQDIQTTIGFGPDPGNKPMTVYFRQTFEVANTEEIKQLYGSLIRDDGAVVYLNGVEVFRSNMPGGAISHTTPASSAIADERDPVPFDIEPSILIDGTNLITAEVHQNAPTSSDLYFSLELISSTETAPKNQGLLAEFYTNKGPDGDFAFDEFKSTAIDANIDFPNLDPILGTMTGQADLANIRWTGQITPEITADYTFYMIGDNGFRLWIDDMSTPLIDFWEDVWDREQTSLPIRLEAGQSYDFKIEYFENFGGSNLFLRWSAPGISKQIVPAGVFTQPASYAGPSGGKLRAEGNLAELQFTHELDTLPQDAASHFAVQTGSRTYAVRSVTQSASDPSTVVLELNRGIEAGLNLLVSYDGGGGLSMNGEELEAFRFGIVNQSQYISYEPIAIAMSLHGSPQTNRAFAWYTNYNDPAGAPANIMDSIVEVVPAGGAFDTAGVLRYTGESQELHLRMTNSTNATFIGHKVMVDGLTPGTAYQYRLGSDGNWSETGYFTTEAADSNDFQFLHLTDSQGGNSSDYEVWANTLRAATTHFPASEFLIMTGDMVDAGALEYQWLDFFGKPQDILMDLPIQAAVGNHEGPYNDNYYYHFYYPNDQINDPLPPGSVYHYEYGDALFMIINTMDMAWDPRQRDSFDQQLEWIRRVVAQTDKKWKFVAFHRAAYSLGNHHDKGETLELRNKLYPVMDELGIDMVFQGHDHSYTRTFQMYNDQAIKDVETNELGHALNPDGTVYVINNAAGTKFYDIRTPNNYYGAVFEQPRKQVYSGIDLIGDSLTYTSYRLGEDEPFDTYTIVRDDSKPEPVEDLTSGVNADGEVILSWSMPDNGDQVRGFRIYEENGKMQSNLNWSAYIPAEAGQKGYSYTLEGLDPNETYTFIVKSVDQRNNSDGAAIQASNESVAAPTGPITDDGFNTFDWTNVPGFDNPADYEYSVNGGETWAAVTAKPQPVGDADYAAGDVRVRVKADPSTGREAGLALQSREAYTKNSLHRTYNVTGTLTRGEKLQVEVDVRKIADSDYDAHLVFQLMKGKQPMLINAVPLDQEHVTVSQYFNTDGGDYSVNVFVFDGFNGDMNAPPHLAQPLELK